MWKVSSQLILSPVKVKTSVETKATRPAARSAARTGPARRARTGGSTSSDLVPIPCEPSAESEPLDP
jgi:hypothetical protein